VRVAFERARTNDRIRSPRLSASSFVG